MNEIVKKFLLAGDKFLPKIYLRQSEFTLVCTLTDNFQGLHENKNGAFSLMENSAEWMHLLKQIYRMFCFAPFPIKGLNATVLLLFL